MERLRERGVPADNIRLYRARVVVPASPDHGIAR